MANRFIWCKIMAIAGNGGTPVEIKAVMADGCLLRNDLLDCM